MALTDNLIGYWKLDESSGNAADATGNGWTLTNSNTVAYNPGKINNAADGGASNTNKHLGRTDALSAPPIGNFSASCWVNVTTAPGNNTTQQPMALLGGGTTPFIGWSFRYDNTGGTRTVQFHRSMNNVANDIVSVTQTLTVGTWYHLVIVNDGTHVIGYINGSNVGQVNTSGTSGTSGTDDFNILCNHNAGGDFWSGLVDEAGYWTRALTPTEVTTLYNGGAGLSYPFTSTAANPHMFSLTGVGA